MHITQSQLNQLKDNDQNLEPFKSLKLIIDSNFNFPLYPQQGPPQMSLISYSQFQKDFQIIKELGRGTCASVFKIRNRFSNEIYALKVCQSSKFTEFGQITSEIEIITKLNDEAIPKIFHYYYKDDCNQKEEHVLEVGIIMELCDRTLEEEVALISKDRTKAYGQKRLWEFMREMVRFFAKMQRLGYSHRDIKSGNIMIKDQGPTRKYKVIDFGYSLKDTPYASQSITGTSEYASPKIKRKFDNPSVIIHGGLNVKDDVYSLGKTILELLRGKNTSNQKLSPSFFNGKIRDYDPNISFLLSKMLEYDEKYRWDFIRVEEEMILIETLKASKNIVIDEDDQISFGSQKMGSIQWESSQYGNLSSQHLPISFKKIKDSRTIETQTQSIQIQTTSIYEQKFHYSHLNSAQTRYLQNESITSEVFLNRCSFDAEVYSMKAFDDFVLFGMRNHIGVIPLKHKNDAIYMLRPTWFDGKTKQAVFHKIIIVETKIVFIGSFEHFFFCELNDLAKQLNFLFQNHEQMEKDRMIRYCWRKSSHKMTDYREPKLFEGKLGCLTNGKSESKISCMHVSREIFLGMRSPLIFGHNDGTISIFTENLMVYKDDDEITDIATYDGNKLLFSTTQGWMKLFVYPSESIDETVKPKIYKFNAGSQIIRFNLLNPVKTQPNSLKTCQDQPLVEVYTEKGEKSYLDHVLLRLKMKTLKRDVVFSKVIQSPWKWSLKKPAENFNEEVVAQRKISHSFYNFAKMETYLVSENGEVFEQKDLSVVVDFKMTKSIVFDVSSNLLTIADQQGNVKLLYTEQIFDNLHKPKVPVEKPEVSKASQRVSDYFSKIMKKLNSSSELSSTQVQNPSQQQPMPKTHAQFLRLQGRQIDYGLKRGEKLKFFQSFDD